MSFPNFQTFRSFAKDDVELFKRSVKGLELTSDTLSEYISHAQEDNARKVIDYISSLLEAHKGDSTKAVILDGRCICTEKECVAQRPLVTEGDNDAPQVVIANNYYGGLHQRQTKWSSGSDRIIASFPNTEKSSDRVVVTGPSVVTGQFVVTNNLYGGLYQTNIKK